MIITVGFAWLHLKSEHPSLIQIYARFDQTMEGHNSTFHYLIKL